MLKKQQLWSILSGMGLSYACCAGVMGGELDSYSPYDGIYVGADICLAALMDKVTAINYLEIEQLSHLGAVGGGFIGYDYSLSDRFKLGLEFFGNANGLNASIQPYTHNGYYHVNSRYSLGLRLLPGYELMPGAVAHVILGYSNTQFQLKDQGAYGYLNQSFHKSGFQTGLGFLVAATRSLFVRLDAMYTNFANQSDRGTGLNPVNDQYYANDLSLFESQISVIYKFNW